MDALLSAVASDLMGRLISFLIGKYQECSAADTSNTVTTVRLQRVLLRARVVVEEAEGRQIANRAMLQQLNQLKQQLCRAAYALDAFRWRDRRLMIRSRSHTKPPSNKDDCADALPVMVESLEVALSDMREFIVLLGACPRVNRQPYNVYLFMESCMFGRQLEKEEIINFLLQHSISTDVVDVLPIVGPHDVGKRTLVEHVCLDERVRERFTKIYHLSSNDLDDAFQIEILFDFTARSLMVINMVDSDADVEKSWRRFYSAVCRQAHIGSKIILISRTEAHVSLGTVPTIRLHPPHREELWYFFRTLAFGASDPDDHPELAGIAMAVCANISDSALFATANFVAASLRCDQNVGSWRRVRKMYAEATMLQLDADAGEFRDACYICRSVTDAPGGGAPFLFYNRRKLTSKARSELPKVTMLELLGGDTLPPDGKARFDMLMWQSRIPPYVSYVATCDLERARQVIAAEKRIGKRWRDQHDNHRRRRRVGDLDCR